MPNKHQQTADAFSHAIAMVLVPILFAWLGSTLGSVIGIRVFAMLTFGAFGFACSFASAYFRYMHASARLDDGKPWVRKDYQRAT